MNHDQIIDLLQTALDVSFWPAALFMLTSIYFAAEYLIQSIRKP